MKLWGFEVDGVWLSPNFQCSLAAKLCIRPPKVSKSARTFSGSSIIMLSLVGLGFHPPLGRRKALMFCLSVTLLNIRVCAPDFEIKALEYRNDFEAIGQGRFVVCVRVQLSQIAANCRHH